jgi:hypothetical protein
MKTGILGETKVAAQSSRPHDHYNHMGLEIPQSHSRNRLSLKC